MTFKAWLDGHEFDLEDLTDLLPTGDTQVVKEGGSYYLTPTEIDNRPEGVPFYEVAPRVLLRVNGLGRARNPRFRPVNLSGCYEDGDSRHAVVAAGIAEARARVHAVIVVTNSDGVPTLQASPPGPQHASLAPTHANVAEALAIMGQPGSLGWVEMWKVYEIVRDV